MYKYIERIVAPKVCEFYALTPQGHRIVRIYLDGHSPRIVAFNETSDERSPATLFLKEIHELIARSKVLLNITDTPTLSE